MPETGGCPDCDVKIALDAYIPAGITLTFSWSKSIPKTRITFVLIDYNESYSYIASFSSDTSGLDMRHSNHVPAELARSVEGTNTVNIVETNGDMSRNYTCELKHVYKPH